MILFVGTEEDGSFISEVAEKENQDVVFSGYQPDLKAAFNIIMSRNFKYIVLNIETTINDYHEVSDIVKKIKSCTNSTIIAYAQGYNYRQDIIQALFQVGVVDFILSTNLSGKYQEIERALRGKNTHEEISLLINIDESQEADTSLVVHTGNSSYKTVGLMGCMSRIGTTTQAVQIVKYLMLHGKKAAYIEMNNSGFVELMTRYYAGFTQDDRFFKITYQNVDMFYRQDKISEILNLDYDYFIYDYGVYAPELNRISFLEKNINIVVAGTKPNEIVEFQKFLSDMADKNIEYIFSFSDENEQGDILEMMEDKASKTHFSVYSPDAFSYLIPSNKIYDPIFQMDASLNEQPQKKKKSFWNWGKKNG